MTTTDRELKPGDRVLVEAEVLEPIAGTAWLRPLSIPGRPVNYRSLLADAVRWHHDDRAELAAEVERLRAEQSDAPDESSSTKPDTDGIMQLLLAENRLLRRQRDEAWAQVAAMRPVVQAAEAFVVHRLRGQRWTLEDAVDAYRADQS